MRRQPSIVGSRRCRGGSRVRSRLIASPRPELDLPTPLAVSASGLVLSLSMKRAPSPFQSSSRSSTRSRSRSQCLASHRPASRRTACTHAGDRRGQRVERTRPHAVSERLVEAGPTACSTSGTPLISGSPAQTTSAPSSPPGATPLPQQRHHRPGRGGSRPWCGVAEADARVGIVGIKQLFPYTNRIHHTGIIFTADRRPQHIYPHADASLPYVNKAAGIPGGHGIVPADAARALRRLRHVRRGLSQRLRGRGPVPDGPRHASAQSSAAPIVHLPLRPDHGDADG